MSQRNSLRRCCCVWERGPCILLLLTCWAASGKPAAGLRAISSGHMANLRRADPLGSIRRQIAGNHLQEAERQAWQILSQDPDNAGALELLAEIRTHQRRYAEAESLVRRCLVLK